MYGCPLIAILIYPVGCPGNADALPAEPTVACVGTSKLTVPVPAGSRSILSFVSIVKILLLATPSWPPTWSVPVVAILPEVEEVQDIAIDKNDLRVDTFRASGAGGQHVNKTDSAVRLTHIPSGLVVECQDGRSQHKNKEKALSLLASKLKQQEIESQQESIASERKILVGTGDRSEKIRTYNFPQGRMTDHRIKLTQHNLDQIMDGDIKTICDALLAENQLAMLSQLESE